MTKLINSLTEEKIEIEIVKYTELLFCSELGCKIVKYLEKKSVVEKVNNAYVLKIIPDQFEDTYFILVNGHEVIELEVERQKSKSEITEGHIKIINQESVKEYENSIKGLNNNLSLKIAIKLSSNK